MPNVHYHGTPIWGDGSGVLKTAVMDGGAFISYARPDQIKTCMDVANSIGIDNGAFSAWKRGLQLNWTDFYTWLAGFYHHEKVSFFIIPDVVDGGEHDNDILISKVPSMFKEKSVPVWHLHESMDRLIRLCDAHEKIAFGSSGEFATIRTAAWNARMKEAFTEIYIKRGFKTKVHGLRMLDGRILGNYPLHSADSTNLACNVPKFKVKYPGITENVESMAGFSNLCDREQKSLILHHRCAILRRAIESVTPPTIEEWIECS
ncbi:MAG: hypothetical protein ACRDC6_20425 [Shewanella sp.]